VKGMYGRHVIATILIALFCLFSIGAGPSSSAVDKVRQGIGHFRSGDYPAAVQAFSEADVAEPENETIQFDRACALIATGDREKAEELFRETSLSQNIEIAAQSHYNLGGLAAETARAMLGDDAAAIAPEQRQETVAQLMAAVGHYRDCLRIDSEHEDARYNLELIRVFLKHIQSVWEQQDREKSREETDLLQFLAMIEQRQSQLRAVTAALGEQPNSPQRRQAVQETAESQRELYQEIEPLVDKLHEQFQAAGQSQPQGAGPDPGNAPSQSQQAEELLSQLASEAGKLMLQAATMVDKGSFESARNRQKDTLDRLNQIFMAVAPFANVLKRATDRQRGLVTTSQDHTASDEGSETTSTSDAERSDAGTDNKPVAGDGVPKEAAIEFPELAWQQSYVTDWSRMLSLKAEAELEALEAQQQSLGPGDSQSDADSRTEDPSGAEQDAAAAQLESLQESLRKAIELGPDVEQHSSDAVADINEEDLGQALPHQQEALRLLEEIAEPLAQQNQQNQDQQDSDSSDQNQQQQQQQADSSEQNQQNQQQQQQRSPQERAMSALRRARERERQHRDLQKQMQQIIGGRVPVDRDW